MAKVSRSFHPGPTLGHCPTTQCSMFTVMARSTRESAPGPDTCAPTNPVPAVSADHRTATPGGPEPQSCRQASLVSIVCARGRTPGMEPRNSKVLRVLGRLGSLLSVAADACGGTVPRCGEQTTRVDMYSAHTSEPQNRRCSCARAIPKAAKHCTHPIVGSRSTRLSAALYSACVRRACGGTGGARVLPRQWMFGARRSNYTPCRVRMWLNLRLLVRTRCVAYVALLLLAAMMRDSPFA